MSEAPNYTNRAPLVANQSVYFSVSTTKLVVMSVVTFGFYELLWFYQNWRAVKEHRRLNISPAARSLFAPFFCFGLFKEIRRSVLAAGLEPQFHPLGLAVLWIVLALSGRLPGPYSLLALLSPLALVPVQAAVNQLNQATSPSYEPNDRFTGWNIAGIVVGGLLLLLALVGSFIPESPG